MRYFIDTVFQIKRNPDLRHLCHCRFADTLYDSSTMFSVDVQSQVCDGKAKKIYTWGVFLDYPDLRVSLISILLILKWDIFLIPVQLQIQLVVNQCQFKQLWEGYLACEIIQPVKDYDLFPQLVETVPLAFSELILGDWFLFLIFNVNLK